MAYELLGDVETVVLGGLNKQTNKRNPTELEGYFLRVEQRPNKFNKDKPQNYYVFKTKTGDKGLYGKAGIDREMKKAKLGAMTKVVFTGEKLDLGKGNPMLVFKVYQDRTNAIEVDETPTESSITSAAATEEDTSTGWSDVDDEPTEEALFDDEGAEDEIAPPMPKRPTRPVASAPSAERQAKLQALLNKR